MDTRDVANGIVFTRLNLSIDTFENRLIAQKKIYLLQGLGTDLGYSYNWYIRGPYSPALSKYICSNYEMLSDADYSKFSLVGNTETNIKTVNIIKNFNMYGMGTGDWYELLASILYLYHNYESFGIKKLCKDTLIEKIGILKPTYSRDECSHGIRILSEYGFFRGESIDN